MTPPPRSYSAPRILGTVEGTAGGPALVLLCGVHGNEPAGCRAAQAVLAELREARIPFQGRLLVVIGNRTALTEGRRFIDHDLNRHWTPDRVRRVRNTPKARLFNEDLEKRELLDLFEPMLHSARDPVVFLDLHSTSGPGVPFVCMADVIRNRRFGFAVHVPVVLGLEEKLPNTMLGYLTDLGHVGIAIEGGQHEAPDTERNLRAAIWSVLTVAGAVEASDVPEFDSMQRHLQKASADIPQVTEILHRHRCTDGDGFVMEPGFRSFEAVEAGELVATDHRGAIRTPVAGLMMLPRYQGQGEDGYFLARAVRPFWLAVSAQARRLGTDRLISSLPGVERHPERPDHFQVDLRVARYQVVNIFHLLGFRRETNEGGRLVFSRRRPDEWGPMGLPPLEALEANR